MIFIFFCRLGVFLFCSLGSFPKLVIFCAPVIYSWNESLKSLYTYLDLTFLNNFLISKNYNFCFSNIISNSGNRNCKWFFKNQFHKKIATGPFFSRSSYYVFKKHAIKIIRGYFRMGIFGIFSDYSITYPERKTRKLPRWNYLDGALE